MLVASDEESGGHVLGHDVQPGGVQGGAGGASLGQRQGHHHQLRRAGVGAEHFSQTEMPANIAFCQRIAQTHTDKYTSTQVHLLVRVIATTTSRKSPKS